jgi:hypothetical protein
LTHQHRARDNAIELVVLCDQDDVRIGLVSYVTHRHLSLFHERARIPKAAAAVSRGASATGAFSAVTFESATDALAALK